METAPVRHAIAVAVSLSIAWLPSPQARRTVSQLYGLNATDCGVSMYLSDLLDLSGYERECALSRTEERAVRQLWRNVQQLRRHLDNERAFRLHQLELIDSLAHFATLTVVQREIAAEPVQPFARDCSSLKRNGYDESGVYPIHSPLTSGAELSPQWCEMRDEKGWLLIQRRQNTKVRNWKEYKAGFGGQNSETDDFWLGLDLIHNFTIDRAQTLRIELTLWNGTIGWGEWGAFLIGPETDFYRLTVGEYSGTIGNSLGYHHGQCFSTPDADHDNSKTRNCARAFRSGWWFAGSGCRQANLNGVYQRRVEGVFHFAPWLGISWSGLGIPDYSVREARMMISPAAL